MRLRISLVAMSLLVAACGTSTAGSAEEAPAMAAAHPSPRTHGAAPPTTRPSTPSQPVWEGFDSAKETTEGLTAVIHGPAEVFESPTSDDPWTTLDPTTILGTTTVLAVVAGPEHGRFEVMLPLRPNGSTGWIESDGLDFYVADGEVRVDLSDRELTYVVDGTEVLRTKVGVGSEYNQTPTGVYFVTDSVTLTDPGSPWGPHALGLSARSDSITEFNGGDGIIGIHGTNNPGSIGDDISLGCIRLRNEDIEALHAAVPIGTRVTISA